MLSYPVARNAATFRATISTNIGYVMPQESYYRQLFRGAADVDVGIRELTDVVRAFGLPFMRRNCTLQALRESMEGHLGWPDNISYSLPVAYLLLGKTEVAHERIARRLYKLEKTPSPATDQYRQFASRFAAFSAERPTGIGSNGPWPATP